MLTSGAVLRSETPVEDVPEVALQTSNMTCWPGAAFLFDVDSLGLSKLPPFDGIENIFSKMPFLTAIIMAGGWKKVPENSRKDKVHKPDKYSFLKHMCGAISTST